MLHGKLLEERVILNSGKCIARTGVIVMDSSLNVLASNAETFQIFGCAEANLAILSKKVCGAIVERREPVRFAGEFQSLRRTYVCRTFPIDVSSKEIAGSMIVTVIERKSNQGVVVDDISARFGLTEREGQTVQFLMEGLTSKEIAARMNISGNTVKAFIRFVMTKMGVSTRSGIVGRALSPLELEKVS